MVDQLHSEDGTPWHEAVYYELTWGSMVHQRPPLPRVHSDNSTMFKQMGIHCIKTIGNPLYHENVMF